MAITVPYYRESQRLGSAPDGRFSINGRALDLASGREAWGAVERAGAALGQTGRLLGDIALREQREHNQTLTLEKLTEFEQRAQALQGEQSQRQGKNALISDDGTTAGVADVMRTSLEQYRTELTKDMNDAQKKLFDGPYQQSALRYGGWGARYEADQRNVWNGTVEDGSMAQNAQRAIGNVNDHGAFLSARGNIEVVMQRRGQRQGWDEAYTKAQTDAYLSKNVYAPSLDAMIERGELKTAQGFLKQFGPEMGTSLVAGFEGKIKDRGKALAAEAEKARFDGVVSGILSGVSDLPTLEEQREAAFAKADTIADPKIRDKVRTELRQEMSWRKDKQDATTAKEVMQFQTLARTQGWNPLQAKEQLAGASNLSDAAREKLEKDYDGKAEKQTPANKAALTELRRLIDLGAEQGGMDKKDADAIDAYIYRNGLTFEQGRKAHAYAEQGGAAGELSQSHVNRAFKALFPKRKQSAVPGDLYDLVALELEPGKPVTDEQVRRIVSRLYADALRHERPEKWSPDNVDVPLGDQERIEALLRKENVAVTPERVRRLYWEEREGKR